jgi:histidine triad (HIT) family protein
MLKGLWEGEDVAEDLFCRIIAGEVPAERVYESKGALAFLDVNPVAPGHTLVIPKKHATTLIDLDDESIGELFRAVKAVMMKINKALQPSGFHVGWNHGAVAGQHVFHLHVHILPRQTKGYGIQALGEGGDKAKVAEIAAAIRAA